MLSADGRGNSPFSERGDTSYHLVGWQQLWVLTETRTRQSTPDNFSILELLAIVPGDGCSTLAGPLHNFRA